MYTQKVDMFEAMYKYDKEYSTWAARSTRIFENEVSEMCSYFNLGTILNPTPGAVSRSYSFLRCPQDILLPLFCIIIKIKSIIIIIYN